MKKTNVLFAVLFAAICVISTTNIDAATKSCALNLKKWSSCTKVVTGKTENSLIYDYGTIRPSDDASVTGWAYTYDGTKRLLSLSGYIEVTSKRVSLSQNKKNAVRTSIKQNATLKGFDYATNHSGLTSQSGTEYAKFIK